MAISSVHVATAASPAALRKAAYPTDDSVAPVVDRYVSDAKDQRFKMGQVSGLVALGLGAVGTGLGLAVGGGLGAGIAGAVGLGAGVAAGLYNSKHFMEGQERFMTCYFTGFLATMQASLAAALASIEPWPIALLGSLAGATTMAVGCAAWRSGQSRKAVNDLKQLDRELDQALQVDALALAAKRQADAAGSVQQDSDFVTVNGVKIRKEGAKLR